jgi:hypothetical protein
MSIGNVGALQSAITQPRDSNLQNAMSQSAIMKAALPIFLVLATLTFTVAILIVTGPLALPFYVATLAFVVSGVSLLAFAGLCIYLRYSSQSNEMNSDIPAPPFAGSNTSRKENELKESVGIPQPAAAPISQTKVVLPVPSAARLEHEVKKKSAESDVQLLQFIPCKPLYKIHPSAELGNKLHQIFEEKYKELGLMLESYNHKSNHTIFWSVANYLKNLGSIVGYFCCSELFQFSHSHPEIVSRYLDICMKAIDIEVQQTIIENRADHLFNSDYGFNLNIYTSTIFQFAQHISPYVLFIGSALGSEAMVRKCLNAGISHLSQVKGGYTPFHVALANKRLNIMNCLVKQPNIYSIDQAKETLLYMVNSPDMLIWLLLQKKIKLNENSVKISDSLLEHPLERWIRHVKYSPIYNNLIDLLLEKRPHLINKRCENGHSIMTNLYTQVITSKNQGQLLNLFLKLCSKYKPELSEFAREQIHHLILVEKDLRFLPCLSELDQKNIKTLLDNSNQPLSKLGLQAIIFTDCLRKELSRCNLAPEMISLELVNQAHLFKRQVQEQLSKQSNEKHAKENVSFNETYKNFITIYREVFKRHPLLNKIREIRHCFIKSDNADVVVQVDKLFALFHCKPVHEHAVCEKTHKAMPHLIWKQSASYIYSKMAEAQKWVNRLPYEKRMLKLLHGTNSSAWPIISKLGKLLASGTLFEMGIAPLTGEGTGAVSGINLKGISTIQPDAEWSQRKSQLPGCNDTRYHTAEGYSSRLTQSTSIGLRPLIFSQEAEYAVLRERVTIITNRNNLNEVGWFDFKRAIYRLRQTDHKFREKTVTEYETFKKALEYAGQNKLKIDFVKGEEILKEWQNTPPVYVDANDTFLQKTVPMLFASTQFNTDAKVNASIKVYEDTEEIVVNQPLVLGRDIQLLFTVPDAIASLQDSALKQGVHVLPLDAGRYLQMRNMTLNEQKPVYQLLTSADNNACTAFIQTLLQQNAKDMELDKVGNALITVLSDKTLVGENYSHIILSEFKKSVEADPLLAERAKIVIAQFLSFKNVAIAHHRDVLPYYAEPYPEKPTYVDERMEIRFLASPFYGHDCAFYETYAKQVETMQIIPRGIHGAMHSTRVTLFSLMLKELYAIAGKALSVPTHLLAIAAGFHDAARQDEGKDYWDRQSAKLLEEYLINKKASSEEIAILTHALAEKDPKDDKFTTIEQQIVNGADTLEIVRVLSDKKEFNKNRLPFYKMPELIAYPKDLLIDEVIEFVRITEARALKIYLEHNSSNYLADIMQIFSHLHNAKKCFPHMAGLLGPAIAAITAGRPALDSEISKMLNN